MHEFIYNNIYNKLKISFIERGMFERRQHMKLKS